MRERNWRGPIWITGNMIGLVLATLGLILPIVRIPLLDLDQRFSEFQEGGINRSLIACASCFAGFLIGLKGHLRWLSLGFSLGGWSILAIAWLRIVTYLTATALKTGLDWDTLQRKPLLQLLPGAWCYTGALVLLPLAFFFGWRLRRSSSHDSIISPL
jgi:hypothetical protein